MLTISRIISTAGLAIILLLSIKSLFIIANTIKIALYARKREINIMKYIGATNWFIRWPFIIEGMTWLGSGDCTGLCICFVWVYIF